jgi:hypothetical protein
MNRTAELQVLIKTYDLILWSCHHTSKFPRNHRFVLGERIERNLYDLLETLIRAKYTRQRQPLLEQANLTLEILRFQMRFAKDLQCLKVESYGLGIKGYIRYVDDFLVFCDNKRHLSNVRERIRDFLMRLRLRLHPTKNVIFPVKEGIRFLGYRIFPTHRLLPKENVRRFRRRVRLMQEDYALSRVSFAEIYQRLMNWNGHARQANTYRLRCHLFDRITFQRATTE